MKMFLFEKEHLFQNKIPCMLSHVRYNTALKRDPYLT